MPTQTRPRCAVVSLNTIAKHKRMDAGYYVGMGSAEREELRSAEIGLVRARQRLRRAKVAVADAEGRIRMVKANGEIHFL